MVICLMIGGGLLVVGVGLLEMERAEAMLRVQLGQRISVTARNLQALLHDTLEYQSTDKIKKSLRAVAADSFILAVRVVDKDEKISVGDWNTDAYTDVNVWRMPDHGFGFEFNVNWNRLTLVQAPFLMNDRNVALEVMVDGVTAWRDLKREVWGELRIQTMLTGALLLFGLFLLRRWFTRPLSEIAGLIRAGAPPRSFLKTANEAPGEFGQLAGAIGTMLGDLSETAKALESREKAFSELYHFAPAAMLSVLPNGMIVNANRRAGQLFSLAEEERLVGQAILTLVDPNSRGSLDHCFRRLMYDNESHCDLSIQVNDRVIELSVDLLAVRQADGTLDRIRLSLIDISQPKKLQRQLANKSQILNLVVEHMSDAILLVDEHGRIAAHNHRLLKLLCRRCDTLVGHWYDPEHFWDELDIENHDLFTRQIRQIHGDNERSAAERFIDRSKNAYLFQSVPVHDDEGQNVGRLWVVQDMTIQDQNERLIRQQTDQLRAIKRLGHELRELRNVDGLLERSVELLFHLFDIEMIGMTLRCDDRGKRSKQLFHDGKTMMNAGQGQGLVEAVESSFMRLVLSGRDAMYWSELPQDQAWSQAFIDSGITSLAAIPMKGSADTLGVFWIARRGGERLNQHHLYLLETLTPTLAGKFELALEHERLQRLELSDSVTDLPNRIQFEFQIRQIGTHLNWAAVILSIDHLRRWNEMLGHAGVNQMLARVAEELNTMVRRSCFLARIDGKSFAVLCPDLIPDTARALADRLEAMMQHIAPDYTASMPLTASIGVATSPDDGTEPHMVVSMAEHRASMAKRQGGNQIIDDSPLSKAG